MEEKFQKANELLTEQSFLAELEEANSHEDVCVIFDRHGVNLSVDDVQKMCEESVCLQKKGELSEEDLGSVNGGIIISGPTLACFMLASACMAFYTSYGFKTIKGWRKK